VSDSDICFLTANELSRRILARELSAKDVVEAHLAQIDRVNPRVNAIVTYLPEQALKNALAADDALARGDDPRLLHGLPIAHKDLLETRGVRTTYGSPVYVDYVPDHDALIVERLKAAGAISVGKTNVPEFGAGSQTFNEIFGTTLNPYDLTKTCGGSSGGAAAALACGMIPLADGSDFGGSLRNPANFCNVVGFRPSVGRVPDWPRAMGWSQLSVKGPMARTVRDAALMLSVMAGPDPRAPISIAEPGRVFARPLERDFTGVRISWSCDLGGLPVDPRVTSAIERQRGTFESLGCVTDDTEPDFTDANEVFMTMRAWMMATTRADLLRSNRDQLKDTVVWNIEEGLKLSATDIGKAEVKRTHLYHRVREFMETYEFMILPVNQHPPFDANQPFLTDVNGVRMETYIDWMRSCYYVSVTGHPAISVPCGFTEEGLPVGVQIVGRHQDDLGVLQLAHAFEEATGFWRRRPATAE